MYCKSCILITNALIHSVCRLFNVKTEIIMVAEGLIEVQIQNGHGFVWKVDDIYRYFAFLDV